MHGARGLFLDREAGLGASGWVFDDAGRMVSQTDSLGNVLEYAYDASGARTELTLPEGTVGFEYDAAGRLTRQTTPWGSLGYGWDGSGNLTDVLRSNGVTSAYEYDAANRVTSIAHTSPGSELGCDLGANDIEVGVDIQTLIDLDVCLAVDIDVPVLTGLDYGDQTDLDYGYDQAGNVTAQTRKDGSAAAVATTYGYDRLSRLVSSTSSDGTDNAYSYDKAGNRTKWVTDHAPDTGNPLTVNAVYSPAGQLTSEKKTRPGLLGIPSVSTTTYTYDDNGNRTREQTGGSVTDYTYTADDRLASIDQGLREVAYEYDGLGRGLVEEVSSLLILQNRTEQLWDGMVVVAQDSSVGGSTSLVRDVTGDVALQASDGLLGTDARWGLTDRLGSTIGQVQGSKISQLAEYSDWGVPVFGTVGWDSATGYTGELGDTTAGVWNFYARSYDPAAATWLHADPYRGELDAPQSLGRYGYVNNNPVTDADYLGFLSNRMQTETRQGYRPATSLYEAQKAANPLPPAPAAKAKPSKPKAKAPAAVSVPTARHDASTFALPLTVAGLASLAEIMAALAALGLAVVGGLTGGVVISLSGDSSTARADAEARANSDSSASSATSPNPEPDCDPAVMLVCPDDEWANAERAREHYDKHGADFGATSESQYTALARQFYQNRGSYQVKTDAFGNVRVYDPKTNTFGSFGPDGTIRTFFKPSSPSYWSRQPGS